MKLKDPAFNALVSASAEIRPNRVISPERSDTRTGHRFPERLRRLSARALLISWVAVALPGIAGADDVTVSCDDPDSADFGLISDAVSYLSQVSLEGPHMITVAPGTCNEFVVIDKMERLTIEAPEGVDVVYPDDDGGTVINVRDSRNIVLRGLTATGAEIGFDIVASTAVRLERNRSTGNTFGYFIVDQSSVNFFSHALDNERVGVLVTRDSYAAVEETEVSGNGRSGIVCREGSMCNLAGNVVIKDNGDIGLAAVNNSLVRVEAFHGPNTVESNNFGVLALGNSIVVFSGEHGNSVSANNGPGIELQMNSSLTLVNSTVSNNSGPGVSVLRDSVARILDESGTTNTISSNIGANLVCDTTSLLYGDLTGISRIDCKRIERALGPPRPGTVN